MPETNTYRKRPVRGKQERIDYYRKNRRKSLTDDDLSLTGMIEIVTDEAADEMEELEETLKEDSLSLTGMIHAMTEDAMELTEKKLEPQVKAYIVVKDEEEDVSENEPVSKTKIVLICLLLLCLIGASFYAGTMFADRKKPAAGAETSPTPEVVLIEETPEPDENPLDALKTEIEAYLSGAEGDWSVYLKDLKTGNSFVINDHQMQSASLIKLFTAGRYLEAVENGEIYETRESAYNLQAMISWSDNDAWEYLETYIGNGDFIGGFMSVTDFAHRFGCVNSGRNIGSLEVWDEYAENLTTASEIGKVLEAVYNRNYVSEQASQRLYELMAAQQYISKIPAGLPEEFESASKSGELSGIENDAAIIHGTDTDYILVVLSNDVYEEPAAEDIAEISYMCAVALNPSAR